MRGRRTTLVQFLVLLGFWFALSRRADPLFVVMGVLTAAIVAVATAPLTKAQLRPGDGHVTLNRLPIAVLRSVGFAFWMAGRIVVASIQIARIAVSRQMPIAPCSVRFRTGLAHPLARTTLANSISLVPGTLTVDIDGDELLVHALAPDQMDDLLTGALQNKVAWMFLEGPQEPVDPATIVMGAEP